MHINIMKMGIMFNWFITTLGHWKLLKKGAKRSKQGKDGVSLLFFTPYMLVWRQNVP